jgi:hypothetical protein
MSMASEEDKGKWELGRKKLMTKLPALRAHLRSAAGDELNAIFMAYERASAGRDRVRAQKGVPQQWTDDYERVLRDLEEGVVLYLLGQRWQDFN